jgi:tetratricopeptide (TPR) repeat protein
MRKVLAAALCASIAVPAAGPVAARTVYDEAWAWCVGADNATHAHRVEGCTWLIRYGDQKGKDLASAFINLGQARQDTRNPAVALASYERAIQLDPEGAGGYASRGRLRQQQGDHAGALADWNRVIRNPGDQFGLIGLGHQWKSVCGLTVSASSRRQRSAMTASRSASVAKCRLTTGSSTKGQRCSAGCSSGL